MKQRGYNQSEFIAIGVAKVLECEMNTFLLNRIEYSESQTKKSKYERWENVGEAFTLTDANQYIGKHILLVDDVVTTGTTLFAAVTLAGAATVDAITIATATGLTPYCSGLERGNTAYQHQRQNEFWASRD